MRTKDGLKASAPPLASSTAWTAGGLRTRRPAPGVRAAARLQLGNFRRPHEARWWKALALTMLLAAVSAALTTVALDDVPMALLVAIALMLVGIFVYVVYGLALDRKSVV